MQTALAPKMAAVPARFAGAQGAGPPPICVSDRMRRAWTDAIVPAFFRVASRRWRLGAVSGRAAALAAAICGRLPRVARWLCAAGGATACAFRGCVGLSERESFSDAGGAPE